MNIKALITTIVLGSTSIAAAAPTVRDHRTHSTQIDARAKIDMGNGRVFTRPQIRPLPQPLTWVTLANNAQVNGRAAIRVPQSARKFTKLELRADQGRTSIDKVMIVFGNGRTQVVDLDAKLTKNKPSVSIDLAGNTRQIERIVLVGKSNGRKASVDVLAI